jgi:hypothetical protein
MPDEKTEKLKAALKQSLGPQASDDVITSILNTLDKQKVFRYHNEDVVSLLSTPGRVLCAIMEDGTMTLRALAVYLNLSETMIDRTVKSLVESGLITKTKLNRQNVYKVHADVVLKHPDIQHLLGAINMPKPKVVDDEVF